MGNIFRESEVNRDSEGKFADELGVIPNVPDWQYKIADLEEDFQPYFDEYENDPDVNAALNDYAGGQLSSELNVMLRKGPLPPIDEDNPYEGSFRKVDDGIQKAMHPVKRSTKTYRGCGGSWKALMGKDPEVGDVVEDKAYMSTAANPDIADHFLQMASSGYDETTMVEIEVPEGTPAVWMEHIYPGESELLLQRGLRLEVTGVEEGPPVNEVDVWEKKTTVKVKVVLDEP